MATAIQPNNLTEGKLKISPLFLFMQNTQKASNKLTRYPEKNQGS